MRVLAFRLSLLLIFTIPWEAIVELPGIGTISRMIGLALVVPWFVLATNVNNHRRLDRFHGAFFLLVVWMGLTVYWSLDPGRSFSGFVTYTQLFVMLLVLWELMDSQERIDVALQTYVIGSFVAIGGMLVNFLNEEPSEATRYGWSGVGVGGAALVLALGIPAAIHLAAGPGAVNRSLIVRLVNYAFIPAAVFGMVLTGTRSAVLASIPTLIFLIASVGRGGASRQLATASALLVTVALIVSFAPAPSLERIASTSDELAAVSNESPAGTGFNGRFEIWRESANAFVTRPLTGVGLNANRAAIETGKVAHNTPLSVLVELGLVGFALFSMILIRVVQLVGRLSGPHLLYWTVQLLVLLVASLSMSVGDKKVFWLFLALAAASGALVATSEGRESAMERASARRYRSADLLVGQD